MRQTNRKNTTGQAGGGRKTRRASNDNVLPFSRTEQDVLKINRKRILVVDDEPHILNLLRINLDERIFEIFEALNGHEAIAKARQHLPHLILLDLMMPGLDGFAVCKTLKEDSATCNIPIVILTAMGEAARNKSMDCKADLFLAKPFSPLRLLAELQRFLGETPC